MLCFHTETVRTEPHPRIFSFIISLSVCLGTASNTHHTRATDVALIEELAMIHCDYSGLRDKWHKLEQGDLFKLRHAEEQMCISSPPDCFDNANEPTAGGLPQFLVECDSPEAALFVAGLDPLNPHHLFHSDCWFFGSQSIILSDFSGCGAEDGTDVQWTPQTDGVGQGSPGESNWLFLEVMGDEGRMFQQAIAGSEDQQAFAGSEDQQAVAGSEDQQAAAGSEDQQAFSDSEDQQ